MEKTFCRTWAEVNLDDISHNFNMIRGAVNKKSRIMGIVKADAYGHGAVPVSKLLCSLGVDFLGVSNIDEAMQLREAGIRAPILILGYTDPSLTPELLENNITQTVFDLRSAREMSQIACAAGKKLTVHIKVDTGMSRLGFCIGEPGAADEIHKACLLEGLYPEGIFTHFASSEITGDAFSISQLDRFLALIGLLDTRGLSFNIRHCANSGAILNIPRAQLDMVRPGLILYGLYPDARLSGALELRPAMQLKSVVSQVKTLPPGVTVSYGRTYRTYKETKAAVVAIGYADGYSRALSNSADVLIHGRRANIIGRICMDMTVVDVTGVEGVCAGDVVTVFGSDGPERIPLEELAEYVGTISYELACVIAKRVPRVYYRDGVQTGYLNYLR